MGVTDFYNAYHKAKDDPYFWPDNSCVSFIQNMAGDRVDEMDYEHWEDQSEVDCLIEISKMDGSKIYNYIKCHEIAMKPVFKKIHREPTAGDVCFATNVHGTFVEQDTYNVVRWKSPADWPIALFPDANDVFWGFSPSHGLKIAHSFSLISTFRKGRKI